MENILQQLKDNEKPFGLMSEEMQENIVELGKPWLELFSPENGGIWLAADTTNNMFCGTGTYRLRPDYAEEPEIVECVIHDTPLGNRVYTGDGETEIGIQAAARRRNFIGFKFEDGSWHDQSIKPVGPDGKLWSGNITVDDIVSGRVKVLHATHVLFRRSKP